MRFQVFNAPYMIPFNENEYSLFLLKTAIKIPRWGLETLLKKQPRN